MTDKQHDKPQPDRSQPDRSQPDRSQPDQEPTDVKQAGEQHKLPSEAEPMTVKSEAPSAYDVDSAPVSNQDDSKAESEDGLEQEAEDMLRYDTSKQAKAQSSKATTDHQYQPAQAKSGISKLALLALLVAAASGTANYWLLQQTLQRDDNIAQLETKVSARSEQVQQLQNQLSSQLTQSQQSSQSLKQQLQQLTQAQQQLQQNMQVIAGKSQNEWALAEADYLLQLAVKRLQFEQDVKTALALLLAADNTLAQAGDNDLLALRDTIARDIGALNAVNQSDNSEILLGLETLIAMVPELPLAHLTSETLPKPIETADSDTEKSIADKLLDVLKPAIRIQKHDRPLEPLLSPSEHQNLRANMVLALQQGQMAALRNQQQLYQTHLTKVAQWFKQFFQSPPESSQRFATRLSELSAKQVSAELPSLQSPAQARRQLTNTLNTLLNNTAQRVTAQQEG